MTEDAFHAALRDNPLDELTWQALADWFDDDGQSERAELLRLTRQMAMMPLAERGDLPGRIEALLRAGVKPVVVQRENGLGMRFTLMMLGRFLMGSPPDEPERQENEAQHEVTLTRPFWLGVYPVTQKQYKAVMGKNPSYFCSRGGGKAKVKGMKTDDFPVEQVSWEDSQTFLEKLNARAEGAEKGWRYALPSEAQWEYACRGGVCSSPLPFHFSQPGTSLSSSQANFDGNYPYGATEKGVVLGRTCKVGAYEANVLGLYDVHGNVWEWCSDWYADYPQGTVIDPCGPPHGSYRVRRGGGWGYYGQRCRAAYRFNLSPSFRNEFLGFRVATVPHECDESSGRECSRP